MHKRIAFGAIVAAVTALAIPAPGIAGSADDEAFRDGMSAYRTQDHERARTIWVDLAERGHANAQSALGFLYLHGLRVEQSDKKAAKWFEAAANQGVPEAQYYLGTMHLQGRGVRASAPAAYFWCELAISLGLTDALQAAYACSEEAARAMTQEQTRLARLRVNQWHAAPPPPAPIKREPTM